MEREREGIESEQQPEKPMTEPETTLSLMANVLNFLSVSSYDYYYTLKHQQCRKDMDDIYDGGIITFESCNHFYECLKQLESVTETDDSDYYEYRRKMRRVVIDLNKI